MPDYYVTFHGTCVSFDLYNGALAWAEENVASEPWQWLGKRRLVVDPRYAEELDHALQEAGFSRN